MRIAYIIGKACSASKLKIRRVVMNLDEYKKRAAEKAAQIGLEIEARRRATAIENHLQALRDLGVEVNITTAKAKSTSKAKAEGARRKGRSRRAQYEEFVWGNPGKFATFKETLAAFYALPHIAGGSMRYCCHAFSLALQGKRDEAKAEWERSGYPLRSFSQYWENERKLLGVATQAWPHITL
jgi:hypothetical protein